MVRVVAAFLCSWGLPFFFFEYLVLFVGRPSQGAGVSDNVSQRLSFHSVAAGEHAQRFDGLRCCWDEEEAGLDLVPGVVVCWRQFASYGVRYSTCRTPGRGATCAVCMSCVCAFEFLVGVSGEGMRRYY